MTMNTEEFIDFGKAAIDFVANYTDSLRDKNVLPDVEPGYLSQLLPEEAPRKAESWQEVLKDVERYIIPGVTHWNSPHFHAFYPTANSYPAIVGEILSSGISCIGFSWIASPACTELEVITMNWLGKLIGLPKEFLNCSEGPGGGVIQGSASEATLVCLLAAKEQTMRRIQRLHPEWDEGFIKNKLIAYTSDQSNSSVEKAGILASVPMKLLPSDDQCVLRGETLLKAIKEDLEKGLIPCCAVATLGTTGTCAFDNLEELGPICAEYNIWLHIDAAYAGAAFVCPEYRYLMSGVEYADSFNINPHKWLLVNFDCSALWVKDSRRLIEAFSVDRIYLAHDKQGLAPDYRCPTGRCIGRCMLYASDGHRSCGLPPLQVHSPHTVCVLDDDGPRETRSELEGTEMRRMDLEWGKTAAPVAITVNWQIPLGRRFRSLKIWFVLRLYGVEGLQEHIRRTIKLAQIFEDYVKADSRFEMVIERSMGLICFRMKGDDQLTKELLSRLTAGKKIYVVAATYREKLIARFVVCSRLTREEDITFAWNEITKQATEVLRSKSISLQEKTHEAFTKDASNIATTIENLNLELKSQKIS